MSEEKENEGASTNNDEIDVELALEASREISTEEAFLRLGEIVNSSLTEEEQEQKIEEVLEGMSMEVNKIYQRKKQEGTNQ